MTLGSLFDGIGGFPYAASQLGIEPVWASEIVSACVSVTKKHFPRMKHLGDITKIKGGEIEPVDIITFGSPCQDISSAGKRAGLKGERSGLFFEAVRIVSEMREKTDGKYPRYVVWENVAGAFSSNKGDDFRAVIEEIAGIAQPGVSIPRPQAARAGGGIAWLGAGAVMGDGWSLAWRTLDAQYWGVPQRRRRIFLVADFRGGPAAQVLFKPRRLPWRFAQGANAWEGIARGIETRVGKTIPLNMQIAARGNGSGGNGGLGVGKYKDPAYTLQENHHHAVAVLNDCENVSSAGFMANAGAEGNIAYSKEVSPTLRESASPCALVIDDQGGSRIKAGNFDISPCLRSETHGNLPIVGQYAQPQYAVDFGRTGDRVQMNADKLVTLQGESGCPTGLYCPPDAAAVGSLCARDYKGVGSQYVSEGKCVVGKDFIVRRLTPLECERLQGFPDGWTEAGHDGARLSDSARYKALGNSVAIPCVLYVLGGVKDAGEK